MEQSKPKFSDFLRAFGYHWSDSMTGAPSIILVLVSVLLPLLPLANKTTLVVTSVGTGVLGIVCGVLSAYLVWSRERQKLVDLQTVYQGLLDEYVDLPLQIEPHTHRLEVEVEYGIPDKSPMRLVSKIMDITSYPTDGRSSFIYVKNTDRPV